jgi:nicotinamide-nucleotide amidase
MADDSIVQMISLIRKKKAKLALAESCTGGLLSSMITEISGVSDIYMGAIVSYSNKAKMRLLNVSDETLEKYGAVSEQTARDMAAGACVAFMAEYSVAITGVAGPTGGTADKPVGLVWLAVAGPGFVKAERKNFSGDRQSIQRQSAEAATLLLLNALQQDVGKGK